MFPMLSSGLRLISLAGCCHLFCIGQSDPLPSGEVWLAKSWEEHDIVTVMMHGRNNDYRQLNTNRNFKVICRQCIPHQPIHLSHSTANYSTVNWVDTGGTWMQDQGRMTKEPTEPEHEGEKRWEEYQRERNICRSCVHIYIHIYMCVCDYVASMRDAASVIALRCLSQAPLRLIAH